MASKHGRLYSKKSQEGGADQSYAPPKSDFEVAGGKGSSNFSATGERFKVKEMAPEVDVHSSGIADSAAGKGGANWDSRKPRFQEAEAAVGGDYETATSDFAKAGTKGRQWITPDKSERDGLRQNQDQVNAPVPYDKPGAFDGIPMKPTANIASAKPRFATNQAATHGEPNAPLRSDFDNAARNTKPSAGAMSGGDRFKKAYDVPSYGDPGANRTASDVEAERLQQKIARQQAQAEADAARAAAQYE